ncbi:methyltransferase domain-containing protein [Emcibacter sp.]|uniref:methyltransferase domain-containing protein n=1 Tax=Emcibacter sp. TaxID=1979954 RepID=UPI002AA7AFE6|nr:methyltransferase domain-containing protein [Emcibacter sp.]
MSKKQRPERRTLGPVPDLERHLPNNWWQSLFNSLYLKTDGDVVENQVNTAREVDLVVDKLELKPGDKILDLCCGQGRHSLELAARGFVNVSGLDRSRYLIRLARKRARERGLTVKFREGDARKIPTTERNYDSVIVMGNSFGYFAREEDDLTVLQTILRCLRPGGRLALDITDGAWISANFDPRSWEWIDENQFVCRERSLSEDGDRLISREVIVHAEKGVIADQIYAERLYSRDRIEDLLKRAGFRDVVFHTQIFADSDRGEDLGMMERRYFLTAVSATTAAEVIPEVKIGKITVLMGDPRLPDAVKKNGVFNDEDLATIEKLKEGLAGLKDYDFEYLDDHSGLIDRLAQNKPGFVFNLCDEGLANDPLKELHVPALLEIFGVPYSGAGPNALSLCYNKSQVRAIAAMYDIPVPLETYFDQDDFAATVPAVFPALIKPCLGDSSIGITRNAIVHNVDEAIDYLSYLQSVLPGQPYLIQEFLPGREFSVGLIGNPGAGLNALPVLEVDYSGLAPELPRILNYESKWDPDSPYWQDIKYHPAELSEQDVRNLTSWSCILFERLDCRDYARFDFRADSEGVIKLLEVNPNPGWCWDGKLNFMAGYAGLSYREMLRRILDAALQRHALES